MTNSSALYNGTYSEWHSPVPYLFGGVAAMLALIAVALMILACSYWKLSGHFEGSVHQNNAVDSVNAENGESKLNIEICGEDIEEKVMVIMAGDEKPTFLAKPIMTMVPGNV
eukprot:Gb_14129 [translate_table: standard]